MSKSIIVIDTPTSCEECNLCAGFMGKHYCPPRDTEVSKGERDCSCPLIEVPPRLSMNDPKSIGFIEGWNSFRSRILGGSSE